MHKKNLHNLTLKFFVYHNMKTVMNSMQLYHWYNKGFKLTVCNENLIFLFLKQNICCGYSKEPSQ